MNHKFIEYPLDDYHRLVFVFKWSPLDMETGTAHNGWIMHESFVEGNDGIQDYDVEVPDYDMYLSWAWREVTE